MREKQVTLSDNTIITVKKLPIGKFGELLAVIQKAMSKIAPYLAAEKDVDKMSNNEFAMTILPKLLADALPEVLEALALAVDGTSAAELEQMGIDEVSEILVAFVETNDLKKLFENVKKVLTPLGINEKSPLVNGLSESPTSSPANTDGAGETS